MSRADIDRLRTNLSELDAFTSKTVTSLEEILGLGTTGKENLSPNGPEAKRSTAQKPTKALNERRGVQGAVRKQTGSDLSPKERQAIATEVVNKTLKILTDAARSQKDASREDGSVPRREASCKTPATLEHLNHAAACARAAFACLRRARGTSIAKNGTQLAQGMIALIGKLIVLGIDAIALKEIRALRTIISRDQRSLSQVQTQKPVDLENLLTVNIDNTDPAIMGLAVKYQGLVLQYIDTFGSTSVVEAICPLLHPRSAQSPFSIIIATKWPADKQDEMEHALKGHFRLLQSLSRSTLRRHGPAPVTALKLEGFGTFVAAYIDGRVSQESPLEAKPIRLIKESIERLLAKAPDSVPSHGCEAREFLEELFPGIAGQSDDLDHALSYLTRATSDYGQACVSAASSQRKGGGRSSGKAEWQALLLEARATKTPSEQVLGKLHAYLESDAGRDAFHSMSVDDLVKAQRFMTKTLICSAQQATASVSGLCSRLNLLFLEFWLAKSSTLRNGERRTAASSIESKAIFEGAVLACNTLVKISPSIGKTEAITEIQHAERQLQQAAELLASSLDASMILALSNLQWRVYQLLYRNAPSDKQVAIAVLAAAVQWLRSPSLESGERDRGCYIPKLIALVDAYLVEAESRPPAQAAELYTSVRTALCQIFRHLSRNGSLQTNLDPAAPHCDDDQSLRNAIALAIRFTQSTKRPCLDALINMLSDHELLNVVQAWLEALPDPRSKVFKQDLHVCATSITNSSVSVPHLSNLLGSRRLIVISLCAPESLSPELIEALLAESHDRHLSRDGKGICIPYKHALSSLAFVTAAHERADDPSTFEGILQQWSEDAESATHAADLDKVFDGLEDMIEVLLAVYPYLETRGWVYAQRLALTLTQRLTVLHGSCDPSTLRSLACHHARFNMSQGDIQQAKKVFHELSIYAASPRAPLDVHVQTGLTNLELASVEDDMSVVQKALASCSTIINVQNASRQQKLSMYTAQADAGLIIAGFLHRRGRYVASSSALKYSMLLLKSIDAARRKTNASKADPVAEVTHSLKRLGLESSESDQVDASSSAIPHPAPPETASRMIRCLLLHFQNARDLGLRKEAERHLQQARRLAQEMGLVHVGRRVRSHVLQHALLCNDAGRLDDVEILEGTADVAQERDLVASALHVALGDWRAEFESAKAALEDYRRAEEYLQLEDALVAARIAKNNVASKPVSKAKKAVAKPPANSTKTRRTTAKASIAKSVPAKTPKSTLTPTPEDTVEFKLPLVNTIRRQRGLAYLRAGELGSAQDLLGTQKAQDDSEHGYPFAIAMARFELACADAIITTDVTYNMLPESTLSVPSCGAGAQDEGSAVVDFDSEVNLGLASVNPGPTARSKRTSVPIQADKVQSHLSSAKRLLARSITTAVSSGPSSSMYDVTSLIATSSMYLTTTRTNSSGALHPCTLAWSLEIPSLEATRRQYLHLAQERRKTDQGLDLQSLLISERVVSSDIPADFQADYNDVLPSNWTTLSMTMNEDGTELWVAKTDDQIEESEPFTFTAARSELRDIIEASDYSCHNPPDSSTKNGKSKWWEDREALDQRLHELLLSLEDIWLGGFKSVFSLHRRQPSLLARFRKSFDAILERHLPSRHGAKAKSPRPVLHSHILDLFLGLSLSADTEEKLEDDVLDLLYFVIDTLHWNGEPNAHDEVDFDAMTIATIDAIRAYHDAAVPDSADQHLILRLEKRLHIFPWESLPCLQDVSVTRVASLRQLRDRILAMRRYSASDRHAIPRGRGTAILNPSGDLVKTEETLGPLLSPLSEHRWAVHTRSKPSEGTFETALRESNVMLYFGHGSGTQYVRERSVQKLTRCAQAVWLMGCSSGKVIEGWGYESESVPLSYLGAGEGGEGESRDGEEAEARDREGMCMSVVATLWDVTDRDIDRFSVAVGKKWGLWGREAGTKGEEKVKEDVVPKTPARKGRAPPKTPGKTPGKTPQKPKKMLRRNTKKKIVEGLEDDDDDSHNGNMSLAAAVAKSRDVCYLRYLNGAASVVYGIPTYLGD
ncbi:hypothetical protein CAC42_8277 [Sphaceloma murrayae]|uniref:separase n=1 Tax=Sphaceloma murrayae TaxID=2082308 RepID=A0A2K1QJF5_9PEZI|nr:hypothetical protein CAC42_8277 [Sphaceloma murrayae]